MSIRTKRYLRWTALITLGMVFQLFAGCNFELIQTALLGVLAGTTLFLARNI